MMMTHDPLAVNLVHPSRIVRGDDDVPLLHPASAAACNDTEEEREEQQEEREEREERELQREVQREIPVERGGTTMNARAKLSMRTSETNVANKRARKRARTRENQSHPG